MKRRTAFDFPVIVYISMTILGLLLFLVFGETLTGVRPNMVWAASLTGFLFAAGIVWIWIGQRRGN